MIDNIKVFEISIEKREPYIDRNYVKKSEAIITNDRRKLNQLMEANIEIIESISAYKIALESKNIKMQNTILKKIVDALATSGINFSEFTSYWAVKDVSYSIYKKTLKTNSLKKEFLKNIIPEFIKDRHSLYRAHGYSFSTLQAVNDSKAHKSNGSSGNIKISKLFKMYGLSHFNSNDISKFNRQDKIFIYLDKANKRLFEKILEQYKINFDWSKNHEGKQTDFLFKINHNIFIMEHKHMKESGGGQDKQMSEIINFISYEDHNVHYISFLDGVYFNVLADRGIKSGKPFEQRKSIVRNLTNNKQNYFVNTSGFVELIRSLLKK